MNVLLIGGSGHLMNSLIIKLKKEGHRVCLLTGDRYERGTYQKVFEKYNFTYDCPSLPEIFESIHPELTIYLGAYDSNFLWKEEESEAVKYSAGLTNLLMSYASRGTGRFIYLSSGEVYGKGRETDIEEQEPVSSDNVRSMVLAQAEELCRSYRQSFQKDIMVLRMDNLYCIPAERREVADICSRMCLEAFEKKQITVGRGDEFSLIYVTDAIELLYRAAVCRKHGSFLYHISSGAVFSEKGLAEKVAALAQEVLGEAVEVISGSSTLKSSSSGKRRILSAALFESEFGGTFFCEVSVIIKKILTQMKKNSHVFLTGEKARQPWHRRLMQKAGWLFHSIIPFAENLIAFIPFFMLNNRAVESRYFGNLDFYLLYVLLFAIIYGQRQATLSAVLAVAGYCFRQSYDRSGFEILADSNTYVWIAQLFILGLAVGYMRDQITRLKEESREEREFLTHQLHDIQDINSSNVRVKDALETQIVNQNDSVGKIYSITSALDRYSPEEVLFYAAEVLGRLIKSKDVAIYTVSNADYARLFSATSKKARQLGNSIRYTQMGELYQALSGRKVFINRKMDEKYPLMANAIYENDRMQMIIMVWGIPWESMTLGQANQLVVISALIQNAVLRANRYLEALESSRYMEGTRLLEPKAFDALVNAYLKAKHKGLTECTLLKVEEQGSTQAKAGEALAGKLRQTDYIGILPGGGLYVLLANTDSKDADFVIRRFADSGYETRIVEGKEG